MSIHCNAKPCISVIIPAFNTESFLDRTIYNIVEEQFSGIDLSFWELIIVDDGSTDGSVEIAMRWKLRFPENIVVHSQTNQGVSVARNVGMGMARGKYIYFMDSDDLLRQGALADLGRLALDSELDMLAFNYRIITPEEYDAMREHAPDKVMTPEPVAMSAYDYLWITGGMPSPFGFWVVWRAIYRREFMERNSLKFSSDFICGEDSIFILDTIFANPRFALLPTTYYFYNNLRPNNATTGTDPRHLKRFALNRAEYVNHIQRYKPFIRSHSDIPDSCVGTIDFSAKCYYKMMSVDAIMLDASYGDLLRLRRWFKNLGGKVAPGSPRFFNKSRHYTFRQKLKRWITAYPLATIMGLADMACGRGLWKDKRPQMANNMTEYDSTSIVQSLPRPVRRRVAIVLDTYNHTDSDIVALDKEASRLISSGAAELFLWVADIHSEEIAHINSIGYKPMMFHRFNDIPIPSPGKAAWELTIMSDLSGVDTVFVKAPHCVYSRDMSPAVAKVIDLSGGNVTWADALL